MRRRLRDTPDATALAELYAKPYDHTQWNEHRVRIDVTAALAAHMVGFGGVVADLSCGDAAVANRLAETRGARLILGDLTPGCADLEGPLEQTVQRLRPRGADLFLCTETLEHLDDPDAALVAIRAKTAGLLVSTPIDEPDSSNHEHLWAWGVDDVEEMLRAAGFDPLVFSTLDLRPGGGRYAYQIWACQ